MAQITLYLDSETQARMKVAASSTGLSVSRWVSNLIRDKTSAEWPPEVTRLAGAWKDFPELAELRATDRGNRPA